MRKNKFIFLALIFLVSLLCITAASAADDAASSDIAADANDVTVLEESIDDVSISDSKSDENVLSNDKDESEPLTDSAVIKNFSDLKNEINYGNDTVYLDADYLYNDGDDINPGSGIIINRPVTVYGNGHIIDGNNKSAIFCIWNSNVVLHDIIFKNAKFGNNNIWGAAINGPATAINCTFIGNSANGENSDGGAMSDGTAINCTFMDNRAGHKGGAIYNVTAINCTFIHNEAGLAGGAAYLANATNCIFIANHAKFYGGAIYEGSASNCIFLSNSADDGNDTYSTEIVSCIFAESATFRVFDFITVPYSGEKQMVNLIGNGGELLYNVPVTVKITKDGAEIANHSCLSGDGWAVNLGPGKYNATFSVDYANVEPLTCAISITSGKSFTDLDYLINRKYADNSTISLDIDYEYDGESVFDGITLNRNLTIDGNGHTLNGSDLSRIFHVTGNAAVTFKNILFTHGFTGEYGYGGAIWAEDSTVKAIKCNFTYNQANTGGAIAYGDAEECYFAFNNVVYTDFINGGAIYNGNAVNCIFMDNKAEGAGGAIFDGNAVNCTFIHNEAGLAGGAAYLANATNCIFIANHAKFYGGAIYEGSASNCIFLSNSADDGNDTYSTEIVSCIFAESATFRVFDFITVPYSGEKQMVNLIGNGGELLYNVPVTVKITKDGAEIANHSCLSGDGWAVNLGPGKYNATFSVDYANVEPLTCAISITSGKSFTDLDYLINRKYADNSTISLDIDYEYDGESVFDGITLNRNLTIDGNGHTLNGSDLSRIFHVTGNAAVTFKNILFTHGFTGEYGYGGAIWAENSKVKAIKCNFTYNQAYYGGAIANGDAEDCTFMGNNAYDGGAIYNGDAVNCTFICNEAEEDGGAIYNGDAKESDFIKNNATGNGGAIANGDAEDCTFESNYAENIGGAIYNGDAINSSFIGNHASAGGAIAYGDAEDCTFESNYAIEGGAITGGNATRSNFTGNNATGNGTAIYAFADYPGYAVNCIFTNNNGDGKEVVYNCIADSCIFNGDVPGSHATLLQPVLNVTNFTSAYNDGSILVVNITTHSGMPIADANIKVDVYTTAGAFVGTYNFKSSGWIVPLKAGSYIAKYNATDYDVVAQGSIVVNKTKTTVTSNAVTTVYNANKYLVVTLKDNKGNPISDASLTVDLNGAKTYTTDKNGQIKVPTKGLTPKTYTAKITFAGNDNYLESNTTAKVTINKDKTKLTAKAVKATYNKNKNLVITLKDSQGKALSGAKVTVNLNGAKTYTTDKNGQIKINVAKLVPKKYTAKVTFAGNKNYLKSTADVKVTVKKATPKMTAKKKTFKKVKKVKKYTITLKDNTGKAIKKAKVTLKVKGKTYKAKTNSKGKATFKITKLKKKGTFKATVTYKGDKYYNKVTKKAKIKVK